MPHLFYGRHVRAGLLLVPALFLWGAAARSARAQVELLSTVTFSGGLFTYDYSVRNNTAFDLAIVSLNVAPGPDVAFLNPATFPTGFFLQYDSGLGLVSFAEDNDAATPQTFAAGSIVSGFRFQSLNQPGQSSFEALDINFTSFTGVTIAPVGSAIPEPGTLALGALALPGLLTLSLRRRRRMA